MLRMSFVRKRQEEWIAENGFRLIEAHMVSFQILSGFPFVPFKGSNPSVIDTPPAKHFVSHTYHINTFAFLQEADVPYVPY